MQSVDLTLSPGTQGRVIVIGGCQECGNDSVLMPNEVCGILRIDRQSLNRLVRSKQLPAIRVTSKKFRFFKTVVEEYINARLTAGLA